MFLPLCVCMCLCESVRVDVFLSLCSQIITDNAREPDDFVTEAWSACEPDDVVTGAWSACEPDDFVTGAWMALSQQVLRTQSGFWQ